MVPAPYFNLLYAYLPFHTAMPATHGPGGTAAASIGATSRAVGGVFKEASYVGDNDEVDEDEWND